MVNFKETDPIVVTLDALVASFTFFEIKRDLDKNKVDDILRKKQALYKSMVINLCSTWETFFDIALDVAVDTIINNADNANQIPLNVLLRISDKLISLKDKRDIWKISGDGWKQEFRINYKTLKEKFNTPRYKQVDDFVYQALGLKDLSKHWHWKGHSVVACRNRLDVFMDLRGNVTHRVLANERVNQNNIIDYTRFLYRLSCISSNTIRNHVFNLVGVHPWDYEKPKKILHS